MPEKPVWPPTKEDLERFYLVEKLSAAKIGEVYGLKYKNSKVAESTVLYQLKKNGIERRDRTEHISKVTSEEVQDWVRRYQAGESLKKIAKNLFSPVTVMLHLEEMGIHRRNRIEAQILAVTKHAKTSFTGTREEQAYLIGFARGDLNVSRHGRAVRVKTSTTHPLMIEHLRNTFSPYGHILTYPRKSTLAGYEWSFQTDLNSSFSFLLQYRRTLPYWIFRKKYFLFFLAGFFDAEGSIVLNETATFDFQVSLTNSDFELLKMIQIKLLRYGYPFYWSKNKENTVFHLQLWQPDRVEEFLKSLALRHPEKVAKAKIVRTRRQAISKGSYSEMAQSWDELIRSIRSGRDEFVREAREFLESASGR